MARAASGSRSSTFAFAPDIVRTLLLRLRAERTLIAIVAGVVLVTTFVFASAPRLFNDMADDGLTHAVQNANPFLRNLQMTQAGRIVSTSAPDGQLDAVVAEGEAFRSDLAPSIQSIIGDSGYLIDTPRFRVYQPPEGEQFPFPRYITMRHHDGVSEHISYTGGASPTVTDETVSVSGPLRGGAEQSAPIFEIAISTETARQLGVELGERLILEPFADDQLVRSAPRGGHTYVVMEITGLFEVNDTDEEYWLGLPAIDRATEYDDGTTVHIYATAVMSPDAYPQFLARTSFPVRYYWRYFVAPDRFDAGDLATLSSDVRRLEAEYGTLSSAQIGDTGVGTGLSTIFRRYLAQREVTEAILSLATIGLLAVALAVIGLVATLVSERRRQAVALVRGRGGSASQLHAAQLVEGALLTIPAALVGLVAATIVIDGRHSALSVWATVAVAGATTGSLLWASLPIVRAGVGASQRADVPGGRVSFRRLVLDGLIVGLALVGVYLLRRRGLTADSSTGEINEWDPYLAAVPVLLGLAVGVVVLRLYPLPVRLFGWAAALRRDLVPSLGFRRIGRHPGVANLPLLVMVLAVAVGVFASIMLTTIEVGQTESSWQLVGSDYRVDATSTGYLFTGIDLSGVDGVEAIASSYLIPDVKFANRSPIVGTTYFHALVVADYEDVTSGTPAEPAFPAEVRAAPLGNDLGRPSNPIPAVISQRFTGRALAPGDTFALTVFGRETSFVVVESRERFAGIPIGRPFVVVSFDHLQASNPDRDFRRTAIFLRGPAEIGADLEATLDSQSLSARFTSRHEEYADIHDSPLISGVQNGFRIGLVIAAAYSALAIIVSLTISAAARARDLAYLRTLGLSRQQAVALTAFEQAPLLVLALVVGTALGVAVARLVEPGVNLQAFTGEGLPVALRVNWLAIGLLGAGLVATIAGSIALTSALSRRASLGQALRLGDD